MRWFGPGWNAPVCNPATQVQTPAGEPCTECSTIIDVGDQGVLVPCSASLSPKLELAYHLDCFLESLGIQTDHEA